MVLFGFNGGDGCAHALEIISGDLLGNGMKTALGAGEGEFGTVVLLDNDRRFGGRRSGGDEARLGAAELAGFTEGDIVATVAEVMAGRFHGNCLVGG